jgi:hypothetical protein
MSAAGPESLSMSKRVSSQHVSSEQLSRRSFVAGLLAANATVASVTVASAQGPAPRRPENGPGKRKPLAGAPPTSPEPKLWLPSRHDETAVKFPESPEWQRNAPGWYVPSTVSAGACLLQFPEITFLSNLIHNFRELPTLLEQAKSLGTTTLFLVEWYEGLGRAPAYNYWINKGDYIPRADLGGESALKQGIAAVHAQGGRVVLYVEGFIIFADSRVGQEHGAEWSMTGPKGVLQQPYPGHWKPCPGVEGWLAHLEGVARRIGTYGADGIFLDSEGFQKDWKCVSRKHGHKPGRPEVFNIGSTNLVRRVRAALRDRNPEGIVFIEGPTVPRLFQHADGSLDWGIDTLSKRWLWDRQGQTDTLTSGYSLDDWNQIVAIGAKLACGSQFLKNPPGASAQGFLEQILQKSLPEDQTELKHVAHRAFWGLHAWRNAGLILGLAMPGLEDINPRFWEPSEHVPNTFTRIYANRSTLEGVLQGLRPRAKAIDDALAGKKAPAPAEYVKTLMTARAKLAPFIDHGSSVELVRTPFPKVAGYRFHASRGTALTAVSVADVTREMTFADITGTWKDALTGETFTAHKNELTLRVPPHRTRLLHPNV